MTDTPSFTGGPSEQASPPLAELQNLADDATAAAQALWLAALGFPNAPEGPWKEETLQLMALASVEAARRVSEQVTRLRTRLVGSGG